MDSFGVSSRSYLARAEKRLAAHTSADLFYAALELRCGVEARLQEYLEPHEFISVSRKSDWRVGNLHRTAEESFQLGDRIARVAVRMEQRRIATLFYTPVSARLKEIAERLGGYLHALRGYHPPEHEYWRTLRALLAEGVRLLREANTGTLLGPIILNTKTGESNMPIELLPDENGVVDDNLRHLRGKRVTMHISYHDSLAEARSATT